MSDGDCTHGNPSSRSVRVGGRVPLVAIYMLLTVSAAAQHPGHGTHPPMPGDKLYFHCRYDGADGPATLDTPLSVASPSVGENLSQTIELPTPWDPIRVLRYLPSATFEQEVLPEQGDRGRPAIELVISGPTQTYTRWLIADDPDRNRLASLIGSWRYMAVAGQSQRDELLKQFETEFTREPRLTVGRIGGEGSRELDLEIGEVQGIDDLKCQVQVLAFYPHYAMNRETMIPVNRSDRRLNPAVHVEIEYEGSTERRWVFSKFPEFAADKTSEIPFRIDLDCPVEAGRSVPDFVVVTVGGRATEVWLRDGATTAVNPLAVKKPVPIGDSQYRFEMATFVPSGKMVERFLPTDPGKGTPALRIEVLAEDGAGTSVWLESGKRKNLKTQHGPLTVWFGAQSSQQPVGAHP